MNGNTGFPWRGTTAAPSVYWASVKRTYALRDREVQGKSAEQLRRSLEFFNRFQEVLPQRGPTE